jgi:hypothetical protein
MAQGRSRYQRGRVVSTTTGSWEIHYNVYLTDPVTGKPKRHHRSRVVGHALHSLRGANWRPATRRSNDGYLKKQIYPRLEQVALRDISKFQLQMLFNQLATAGYSYNVVYHVRDIIKAALAEAVDQDVLERNVARKTVIPEIE